MGSTTIAALNRMLPQGNAAAGADTKKEKLDEAFANCMQQMSSQLNQMVSKGPDVEVKTEFPVKNDAVDYDHYAHQHTKVVTCEERQTTPEPEKVAEEVEAYGQEVKEAICDQLGVTQEELEDMMAKLGLTVLDLTNPANLAALSAGLIGADDVGDVLFRADFLQLMQEVGSLTAELAQELQVPAEHLSDLLTEASGVQLPEEAVTAPSEVQTLPSVEDAAHGLAQEDVLLTQSDQQTAKTAIPVTNEHSEKAQSDLAGREGAVLENRAAEMKSEIKPIAEEPVVSDEDAGVESALVETVVSVDNEGDHLLDQGEFTGQQKQAFGQTPQHGGPEAHVAAAVNMDNGVTFVPEQTGQMQGYSSPVNTADVIRQIVEFTQLHTAERATTLEMQLNPEHLGKLYLELTSREGNVTAKIYTQNELVREALEAQMADLKVNMSQAGIKVEAVEISAEPHAFEHNLEQQAKQEEQQAQEREKNTRTNRRINLNDMDDLDGLSGLMSEEEALVARIMADNGNSIDFTA